MLVRDGFLSVDKILVLLLTGFMLVVDLGDTRIKLIVVSIKR